MRAYECHAQDMKRERLLCAIIGSVLACCVPATAQEKGNWRATNSTARSITGDVAFSEVKRCSTMRPTAG